MRKKKLAVGVLAISLAIGSTFTSFAAGWIKNDTGWWYQNADNTWRANEWLLDGDVWYYLNNNGYMQVGWLKPADGKWYFLAASGSMQRGLIEVDGKAYFMNDDGSIFIGEKTISGTTYNFTENGTTNGKPSIGARFTGNGNGIGSTSISSGGGTSFKRDAIDKYPEATQKVIKDTNKNIANTLTKVDSDKVTISQDLDNLTVSLKPKKADATIEELGEVQDALLTSLKATNGTDLVYNFGNTKFEAKNVAEAESLFNAAYGNNKDQALSKYSGSHTITVKIDNVDVVYTIDVAK